MRHAGKDRTGTGRAARAGAAALAACAIAAALALAWPAPQAPQDPQGPGTAQEDGRAAPAAGPGAGSGGEPDGASGGGGRVTVSRRPAEPPAQEAPEQDAAGTGQGAPGADAGAEWVLLVGDDTRDGTLEEGAGGHGSDGHSRSDAIMLVRLEPALLRIGLLSVPRDTACEMGGRPCKINEYYDAGGPEALMEQVRLLTGAGVRTYVRMTMAQFAALVDALGGLDADVPIPLSGGDPVRGGQLALGPGPQRLDGPAALLYVRVRKAYAELGGMCREAQQRAAVESMVRAVAAGGPEAARAAAGLLAGFCETNADPAWLAETAAAYAADPASWVVSSGTGPYEGGLDAASGLWLAWRDEARWAEVVDAVRRGGDPQEVVPLPEIR